VEGVGVQDQTISIGEFTSRDEAQVAEGLLRSHGLDAQARLEDAGGAVPSLAAQVQGGTSVHVPVEQADEARALLADVLGTGQPGALDDEPWAPARVRWARWILIGAVVLGVLAGGGLPSL
jgi:hypothetical protein